MALCVKEQPIQRNKRIGPHIALVCLSVCLLSVCFMGLAA